MRSPNNGDRVFNVIGEPEAFLDAIVDCVDDPFNERWVFVVGSKEGFAKFRDSIQRARPDLAKRKWLGFKDDLPTTDGPSVPFCFESEACANNFITTVYCKNRPVTEDGEPWAGRVKALVLINQQGRERFLHEVVGECSPFGLTTYRHTTAKPGETHRMEVCTKFPGWEGIPLSVDLKAPQDDQQPLGSIPQDAMYGRVHDIAMQTLCPMGFAYIAGLAGASVFVEPNCNIRTNVFSAPIGDIHSGKSLAASRTFQLCGLADESDNAIGDHLIVETPASDRGLYKLLPNDLLGKRLMYQDEGRALLGKANITGSTLISALCALFNRNRAGVADKFGSASFNVLLSLLLNLKVKDASEFPEVFTHATSHGLWDRFIFAVIGDEKWRYKPWEFCAATDVHALTPTTPHVPGAVFSAAHEWSSRGEDRDRLSEIALRVAYITTAVNSETVVSPAAIDAALRLMDWQEQIRSVYQPARGANEAEECVKTILAAFTKANGHSYNFRDMARKYHWYEKFAKSLAMTKKTLVAEKVIGFDKASGRHYLTEEKSR